MDSIIISQTSVKKKKKKIVVKSISIQLYHEHNLFHNQHSNQEESQGDHKD